MYSYQLAAVVFTIAIAFVICCNKFVADVFLKKGADCLGPFLAREVVGAYREKCRMGFVALLVWFVVMSGFVLLAPFLKNGVDSADFLSGSKFDPLVGMIMTTMVFFVLIAIIFQRKLRAFFAKLDWAVEMSRNSKFVGFVTSVKAANSDGSAYFITVRDDANREQAFHASRSHVPKYFEKIFSGQVVVFHDSQMNTPNVEFIWFPEGF